MSNAQICFGFVTAFVYFSSSAKADTGDVGFGFGGTYATPSEGRISARGSYGLTDFLSLRADLGLGFSDDLTRGMLSAGGVYAYDVLTWVPEVGVYGGASLANDIIYGRAAALAGVRRYFSRKLSVVLSAGAEYDGAQAGRHEVHGLVDLAVWFVL
ncbi:MAG: hypothetical protein H7Z43_13400 [Clostridia bacterium]|nr:hypothetical protein [Deltaproteobacteria bacterium]